MARPTTDCLGSDGLAARASGPWTKDRLDYLRQYLDIFSKGMESHWPERVFIDLMAGPGRYRDHDTSREFDGSPLLALGTDPPFSWLVFVESDRMMADALRARTASQGHRRRVVVADCNDAEVIRNVRQDVGSQTLAVAFADMMGFEVSFETIAMLTAERHMDLLITFQAGDLGPDIALDGDEGAKLDAFFGTERWRDMVRRFDRGETCPGGLATALADYYGERLKTLGYVCFEQLPRLMSDTRQAPPYRLVLGSRHTLAGEFLRGLGSRL